VLQRNGKSSIQNLAKNFHIGLREYPVPAQVLANIMLDTEVTNVRVIERRIPEFGSGCPGRVDGVEFHASASYFVRA
jgi:hypothetical protein